MSTCSDITILNLIYIFKSIINFIKIIVPVILVIIIIIDIIKNISGSEVDNKKITKSVSKRLIAAVVVFLIPSILNMVLNMIPVKTNNPLSCYQNATKDMILSLSIYNAENSMLDYQSCVSEMCADMNDLYETARKDIKLITDKKIRNDYKQKLEDIKNKVPVEIKPTVPGESGCRTIAYTGNTSTNVTCGSTYSSGWAYNHVGINGLSEIRKQIVRTASLYAGVIPYKWGGKPKLSGGNWNYPSTGLDCSGFVAFIYNKVLQRQVLSEGTWAIWKNMSYAISAEDLKPGDLGFELDYDNGAKENHVGIYVGKDDKGNRIWIHEEGNKYYTVVIGNYNLFKYFRRVNVPDMKN